MAEGRDAVREDSEAFERERLGLLQQLLDPITIRRLGRFGGMSGWHCLEVGAGDGSVACWLAERVGPHGRVVATDIDTRFLARHALPHLEVRRHDILEEALEPCAYDLVHCRAVLMHLADPGRALERMAAALRPGGWLFIEEVDCLSFGAVDSDRPDAQQFDRTMRAILDGLRYARVMDSYFGRHVRGLIERLGLVDVGHEGTTGVSRGGEPGARFQQMNLQFLRPMVAAGLLAEDDVKRLERLYGDPSFAFVDGTCFGAWGRRAV